MSDTYYINNLKCAYCGENNDFEEDAEESLYVGLPYAFEFGAEFVCKKCKQKNKVVMDFVSVKPKSKEKPIKDTGKEFDRWNGKKKMLDSKVNGAHCHKREIWWCSIGVNVGPEQHSQTGDFSRPVIVVRKFTEDIFLGVPLTTKIMNLPFRVRFTLGDVENDALILQMRVYDRKRLVRQIGSMPRDIFEKLTTAIVDTIKTTDPAFAGSSGAEANV